MDKTTARRKIRHEFQELVVVSLLVVPFFVSFAAYRRLLLGAHESAFFDYGMAIVNALVLAKVILIGEIVGLGRRFENKPLIFSTIFKALVFAGFALLFHALEDIVHSLLHHQTFLGALHTLVVAESGGLLLTRALIFFFAFIPFFALRELRRVVGEDEFRRLFVGKREPPHMDLRLDRAS